MLFINLSKTQHGHDQQSRRKIRVEAMRDFRRRQRALNLAKKRQSSQWAKPFSRTGNAPSPTGAHECAYSNDDSSTLPNLSGEDDEADSSYASRIPAQHTLQHKDEGRPIGTHSADCLLEGSPRIRGDKSRQYVATQATPVPKQAAHDPSQEHFYSEQNNLSSRLVTWHSNIAGVFTSPTQVAQMMCLFNHYMRWLLPPQTYVLGEMNMTTYHNNYHGPAFCASILCGIGCLESVSPSLYYAEAALLKTHALKGVNRLLANDETATSNKTLNMLTNVVIHEICRGNDDVVKMHFSGISKILELRQLYPLDIAQPEDLMRLILIDLVHAASLDRSPSFTTLTSPCVPLTRKRLTRCWSFSPLLPYEEPILPPSDLLPISQATWSLLHESWSSTRYILDQVPKSCTAGCHHRVRHYGFAMIEDDLSSNDSNFRNEATENSMLAKACRLAATIHLRVTDTQNKIRYKDSINEVDAAALHDCLSSTAKSSWIELREVAPCLYMWILMTAFASTEDRTRRSWLFSQILRTYFRAFVEDDNTELQCLNNFHWIQKCKRSEKYSWPDEIRVRPRQLDVNLPATAHNDIICVGNIQSPHDSARPQTDIRDSEEELLQTSIEETNAYINAYILSFARAHCEPSPGLPMLLKSAAMAQ